MIASVAVAIVAQTNEDAARAAIEKKYARIDDAVARQDAVEIARLITPEAWVGIAGGLHVPLGGWMASLVKRPGATTTAEIAEFRLSGESATVMVRRHFGKLEGTMFVRDTWEHQGNDWVWKESVAISERSEPVRTSPQAMQPVVDELKQRAARLSTAAAGHGFEDLRAFGDAVGDARVVALGEATHGTREFYQIKHRLLEYLVREKGFTVLALEVNWPDSLAVDQYIKTGEGDLPRILAPGFDEVREMVEWMRSYNRDVAGRRPLTYTSFDMQAVAAPASMVIAYLKRYAPQEVAGAEETYTEATRIWRDRTSVFLPDAAQVAQRAQRVVDQLDAHRSSDAAWRDARHAAAVVVQACNMRSEASGLGYRDAMMARNIEWLIDEVHPHEKIIVWAHNGHVRADSASDTPPMGALLRKRFRKDMYVVGFAFRRGEVWAGAVEDGKRKSAGVWPVEASPEGSGDAILSAAGLPMFFLNMAGVPRDESLGRWLADEHLFHEIGGLVAIGGDSLNLRPAGLSKRFDGLIFFEDTHASRSDKTPLRK